MWNILKVKEVCVIKLKEAETLESNHKAEILKMETKQHFCAVEHSAEEVRIETFNVKFGHKQRHRF